ncbi:MAG: class I fructose-bisphosphate aldolase [Minisyncoccales bacterium]
MKPNLNKIMKKGKAIYLAYDQGLEHGPVDFNDKNIDPNYIIEIAKKGGYNAVIFQKGIAEKYNKEIKNSKVPLIIKLNGKTNLYDGEPLSSQLCSVDEAVRLGAVAVGYTLYIGSKFESKMFKDFEIIQEEAHKKGLPVILWVYPRGKSVKGLSKGKLMAYAARTGLELGADIVKLQYNGNPDDLKWTVKSAGKTKVVIAGGLKTDEKELFRKVKEIIDSGAVGLAIGRNIWQSKNPLKITDKLKKIVWSKNEK